jgi:RHS repeat-associated protein
MNGVIRRMGVLLAMLRATPAAGSNCSAPASFDRVMLTIRVFCVVALQAMFVLAPGAVSASEPSPSEIPDEREIREPESISRQPWEEYAAQIQTRSTLASHGPDLFGDQVNLYNGALTFSVTDISVPGSGPPVELRRTFTVGDRAGMPLDLPFGDWDLDLPRLTFVGGPTWPNTRCSDTNVPNIDVPGGASYGVFDYWQGVHAHIPGGGELLVADQGTPKPSGFEAAEYKWVTPGYAYFRCITTQNGSGDGFEAITPDGTVYRFRRMAQYAETSLANPINIGLPGALHRRRHVLYATEVEDRFGNKVTYTFTNAATEPARLTSIQSNDGRSITITPVPNGNGRIQSATSHGRTWTYGPNAGSLSTVSLPDGSSWILNLGALAQAEVDYSTGDPAHCDAFQSQLGGAISGTVTHPAGATGTFVVKATRHGRSNVPRLCLNTETPSTSDDVSLYVKDYFLFSLTSKSVTGVGLDTLEWAYGFGSLGTWACPGPGASCPDPAPVCTADSCAGTAQATVTGPGDEPANEWTRYTFGNSYRYDEGKLRKVERGTGPNDILQTETTTFQWSQSGPPIGRSLRPRGDGFTAEQPRPRTQHVIARDGATFTRSGSNFDQFARPSTIVRSSSLGYSRTEQLVYDDNTTLWVLGQVQSVTVGGLVPESTVYSQATALPELRTVFGQSDQTFFWHPDGTLHKVTDALDRTVELTNYHRGIPRDIKLPSNATMQAEVNDHGEITSITDAAGFKTSYGHDPMGRITSITHPVLDVVAWAPTSITYTQESGAEYGVPGMHWRRTETTGTRRSETFYDALWRPILSRASTTDASAGTRSVRRAFDHAGREVFVSYPSDTMTNAASSNYLTLSTGHHTVFDVLGRVTGTGQDSELGPPLTTSTVYKVPLSPFTTIHTNARGHATTTTYQAFDQPSYDAPMVITAPEGQTTTFTRDVFGKPLTLTRNGSYTPPGGAPQGVSLLRRFVYDSQQRLCKTIELDAGITVLDYDAVGNLAWKATGQATLTTTNDCQRSAVPSGQRSVHVYDAMNRLLAIDHPAGTDDVGFTYEDDGAIQAATTGTLSGTAPVSWLSKTSEWTYGYNKRRLPVSESLVVPGRTLQIGWGYNTRGDRSSLSYPSGMELQFDPNAYGEPRQAVAGFSFASGATYHPSGALAGFTYGNQVQRTITPNLRQLPERVRDLRANGSAAFDHTLTYDENGNLAGIVDGVGGLESRMLGYDGLDRLTSVTNATQGNETYEYDPLDNLRRAYLTSFGIDRRFHYDEATQRLQRIADPAGATQLIYGWNHRGQLSLRADYLAATEPMAFVFDDADRLIRIPGRETYTYDAHGRRVVSERCADGSIRYQVYSRSGQLLYTEDSRSSERSDYVHLGGALVARRTRPWSGSTSTTTYLHTDHRGTPAVETAPGPAAATSYRSVLSPYGTPYNGVYRDGPGFTGHATDQETGLSYMQQRYYDPVMMRFLSPDPIGTSAQNFNRYWYANNNPYTFTDPDGREACGTRVQGGSAHNCTTVDLRNSRSEDPTIAEYRAMRAGQAATVREAAQVASDAGDVLEEGYYAVLPLPVGKLGMFDRLKRWLGFGGDASRVGPTVFKTTHYATRLERAGVNTVRAEAAVAKEVQAIRGNMSVGGDVAGRMRIDGVLVEYRARMLPDGSVNVGTIFPVAP